jgi:hypothetical protein
MWWIGFWISGPIFVSSLCYCVYRRFRREPEIELEPGQHHLRIVIESPQTEGVNHTYQ